MRARVVQEDFRQVPADVLIAGLNRYGLWYGALDCGIQKVAGNMFHDQASRQKPLQAGRVIFAHQTGEHHGKFGHVIFVVDGPDQSLTDLVRQALAMAERYTLKTVTLPPLRVYALNDDRHSAERAIGQLVAAVREFMASNPSHVQTVSLVSAERWICRMLSNALHSPTPSRRRRPQR